MFTSAEVAQNFVGIGLNKSKMASWKQFILGIMAGMFIAFGAQGSNLAIHTIASPGLAKTLAGMLFSAGLMMVVMSGAELFTGDCLMFISVLDRKAKLGAVLRTWAVVYLGNFVGSAFIAFMIVNSGQLETSGGLLAAMTIKTASAKTAIPFGRAIIMGILCNILVCMAVWLASAAKDVTGKIFSCFFPIWLFVTSGFEHSVANMYYVPAGIFAKMNPTWLAKAQEIGVSSQAIDGLNWKNFIVNNLIPVTIGNIIGGSLFVGAVFWLIFLANSGQKDKTGIK